MIIRNPGIVNSSEARVNSATVTWEDQDYPNQELLFEVRGGASELSGEADEPCADAFLAACYPLAAVHGESRVRVEGWPCPMLVEGLYTAHAWWTSWGGMPSPMPVIETAHGANHRLAGGPRRAVGFLSGGVDSLHMLMQNRRLYRRDDPAYIRDVLVIHGFDIGKRARYLENERYQMMLRRLDPAAADLGVRLISCWTNLRHLPSKPDFWEARHSGAALAAVGHAAVTGSALLFIAGSYPITEPVPWGSHPAVDGLFSSQHLTIVHEGARFSRLEKVRDLATWPAGLAALRVCPVGAPLQANCGRCEKCLRTRLELLAAGVEETEAFGPSLVPSEIWEAAVQGSIGHRAIFYQDLIEPLSALGLTELCRVIEEKIASYRQDIEQNIGPMPALIRNRALRLDPVLRN
jgi:hypothetical protein